MSPSSLQSLISLNGDIYHLHQSVKSHVGLTSEDLPVQVRTKSGPRVQIFICLIKLVAVSSLVKFDPSRFGWLTSVPDPDGKVATYAIAVSAAAMMDRCILLATRVDVMKVIR